MARRTKYFYNPKTLSFEKISEQFRYLVWRRIGAGSLIVVLILVLSFLIASFYIRFNLMPNQQNNYLVLSEIAQTNRQLNEFEKKMTSLEEKDIGIYRSIFDVPPPTKSENFQPTDYTDLLKLSNGKMLVKIKEKVDHLEALALRQEKSYATLQRLSKDRIKAIESIPAIMPIPNKDLRHLAGGFGYRRDPFYHTPSFHPGMDFTAATGTKVYATANGIVSHVKSDPWGYGNHIIINHGNGYITLYGHLSRYSIRIGQQIIRGQLIGFVGNTGRSTGSHLHYEVRKFNNPLNPAFFYRNDLTDEQYQKMIELSQQEIARFD